MAAFLLFRLYAPIGAFGDLAVGERRGGYDRPGRSGIMGLVAGALGIDRRDEAAYLELDQAYAIALKVEATGNLIQDYHTVQAPSARKGRSWRTRREALAETKVETLLSLRDYRTDSFVTVALIERVAGGVAPSPEDIAVALLQPVYTLYLGRKACPLGLPLRPVALIAENLAAAWNAYERAATPPECEIRHAIGVRAENDRFYADADLDLNLLNPDFEVIRVERRRDRAVSRSRWQFALRDELVLRLSAHQTMEDGR